MNEEQNDFIITVFQFHKVRLKVDKSILPMFRDQEVSIP